MNVQTIAYHDFSADEIEFVSLIGDLAAGALDRASLYDKMQRQIAELTTLAKVSETVTSPLYSCCRCCFLHPKRAVVTQLLSVRVRSEVILYQP